MKAQTLRLLGKVYPNTGLASDFAYLFHAEVDRIGTTELSEAIEGAVAIAPQGLLDRIARGEITDGFTLAATAMALAQGMLKSPLPVR